MDKYMQEFLDSLVQGDKKYSDNTIAAYQNDLRQLRAFITALQGRGTAFSWDQVTTKQIDDFTEYLRLQDYASSTVARKVAAVKSFFHFLKHEGVVNHDPTERLDSPKVKKHLPRAITQDEIERLLMAPARRNTPKSMRDRAILEVLCATGMRVTELVSLNLEDVVLQQSQICCSFGDERLRVLPLHESAVEALDLYIHRGRIHLLNDTHEQALFLNHRGKRLTRQGLWLIIKRYVKLVGIEGDVTPHTLRHTFAAHMLRGGKDLREVQRLLGHANLSTTQVYTQLAFEDLDLEDEKVEVGEPTLFDEISESLSRRDLLMDPHKERIPSR